MDDSGLDQPSCPFCTFTDPDGGFVAEHIEYCHPEIDSHFGGGTGQSSTEPAGYEDNQYEHSQKYVDCPHGCGELLETVELSTHLDLHLAETVALGSDYAPQTMSPSPGTDAQEYRHPDESNEQKKTRRSNSSFMGQQKMRGDPQRESSAGGKRPSDFSSTKKDSSTPLKGNVKRLGRTELGPYAHEKQMPSWLRKMLEKGAKSARFNKIAADGTLQRHETAENDATNIIPMLARLCEQDKSVQRAFFCSPSVHQISKMPKEGGFCGYRNIQMLISYIKDSLSPGHECFPGTLPTILQLQDMIERAWDRGFNSVGRAETGGIRGTRKYIGTPEAQALFLSLGIKCEASSIAKSSEMQAHDALLANIATYFRQSCSSDQDSKAITTSLPPVYLQHQGHSLTIIGFEVRDSGNANLLVFDPMFKPPLALERLKGTGSTSSDPSHILKGYRRGGAQLQRYKLFEVLKLSVPPGVPDTVE